MDYISLGRSGLKVSRICLGTLLYGTPKWRPYILDEEASRPFFRHALELGINFFDTADMYSLGVSEEVTGRALSEFGSRDEVVIATKAFYPMSDDPNDRGLSRKHLMTAVEGSLRRLGTEYIDLYQIHRWDPTTPIEETLTALHDMVRSGKVRYIGASTMMSWQFAKALHLADQLGLTRFVSMQNHYNLVYREEEREMLPLCLEEGIGVIPWSPLARGFLAGNRQSTSEAETLRGKTDAYAHALYYAPEDFTVADRVAEIARERGVKPAQIALAWVLRQPGITAPIIGASKLEQLDQAVEALAITLSDDETRRLEEPYLPHKVLGV
jgi:aryl-alcohol dehydrogenase (NADP+)